MEPKNPTAHRTLARRGSRSPATESSVVTALSSSSQEPQTCKAKLFCPGYRRLGNAVPRTAAPGKHCRARNSMALGELRF